MFRIKVKERGYLRFDEGKAGLVRDASLNRVLLDLECRNLSVVLVELSLDFLSFAVRDSQ